MDWQSLAILAFGLCPGSLLVGFIGAVWLVRQLGVKWPWEQSAKMDVREPQWVPYSQDRIAAEDGPAVTARELARGSVHVHTSAPTPGVLSIHFVRPVK